jgi:anthranilate synthase/aminodeoxychorismate synthase-like glutamine amidotransferase
MILIIDNYDSFVHNLARYVRELNFQTKVVRNDKITLEEIYALNPSHIIISPGPCTPNEAGISLEIVKTYGSSIPTLGVCLGHQVIAQAYGGTINRTENPMHGKQSIITHQEYGIFKNVNNPLQVARYHSLIVAPYKFPQQLAITAECDRDEIMAIQHKIYPVFGVQFHPESILTNQGYKLLKNFLRI